MGRKGLRDNTLVLFLSDNGGIAEFDQTVAKAKGDKPAPADNTPYRGSKTSLYEEGASTVLPRSAGPGKSNPAS